MRLHKGNHYNINKFNNYKFHIPQMQKYNYNKYKEEGKRANNKDHALKDLKESNFYFGILNNNFFQLCLLLFLL